MPAKKMILGKGQYYDLDTHKTCLNNNVFVVGASGTGKTRSIVIPNLLQATRSYIVSDPKGNLYGKYKGYLERKGYVVKKLDFTDPDHSARYNFFNYIHDSMDVLKIAHMLVKQDDAKIRMDPFWEEASQLLIMGAITYLIEFNIANDKTLQGILKLLRTDCSKGDLTERDTILDILIRRAEKAKKDSESVKLFKMAKVSADRTYRSILITIFAKLGRFDNDKLSSMMSEDDIDLASIGQRKTALFVVVSDTDRSMDTLAEIFFTQAMNELCLYADNECEDCRLPVPVRFILDDFATNCKILDFPRMIASIRSREISAMLMVQTESQLEKGYGDDAETIIGNCDTYLYLGGTDIKTAKSVAERSDIPMKKILNMPVGTNWLFRRGQEPINGTNLELNRLLKQKGLLAERPVTEEIAI